jgi:hypothetical protein
LPTKKQKSKPTIPDFTAKEKEVLARMLSEARTDWRHFDSHIWQIPTAAIAVNTFLVSQAFGAQLTPLPALRIAIVLSSAFLTWVLLIALVKHRLHQRSQDRNIEFLREAIFNRSPQRLWLSKMIRNFGDKDEFKDAEPSPYFLETFLRSAKAHRWLMGAMGITVLLDIGIATAILFGCA